MYKGITFDRWTIIIAIAASVVILASFAAIAGNWGLVAYILVSVLILGATLALIAWQANRAWKNLD